MSDFGNMLRRQRKAAGLSLADLAERSGVSARAIADLELGKTRRPHMDTVGLVAGALRLTGDSRAEFMAAARGPAAMAGGNRAAPPGPPGGDDPGAWLAFVVATLDWAGVAAARSAMAKWEGSARPEPAWRPDSRAHPGGHVAYVEQVNSPTSIVISEMNYDDDNGFRVVTITSRSANWPADFIHVHDR